METHINKIKSFYKDLIATFYQIKIKEILIKLILLIFLSYFLDSIPLNFLQNSIILKIFNVLILYLIINLLISLIRILITSSYKIRNKYPHDYIDNFILSMRRISTLIIIFLMIPAMLSIIGLKISDVLTSMSLFAVAIVLLTKDYLSNAFNGLIIMFSQDYKLKEYIKIGDIKGKIINIKFLNTQIITDEGNVVFIPNNLFINEKVINLSKSSVKTINFDFSLKEEYYSTIEQLDSYISKKITNKFNSNINENNVIVKIKEIKKDETLFSVEINIQKYNFKIKNEIKNFLAKEVIKFITKKQESFKEEISKN